MKGYEVSARADRDLKAIYKYGARNFGHGCADSYTRDLFAKFALLAEQPRLGREMRHFRPGMFRFEHRSHTIFYRLAAEGIRIVRVLHMSMDPERHI